jgi:hypothetical protein
VLEERKKQTEHVIKTCGGGYKEQKIERVKNNDVLYRLPL